MNWIIIENNKCINSNDIPTISIDFANRNNLDYKKFVKWGGEDFELVACVPEDTFLKLDKNLFKCIGKVLNKDNNPCVQIKYSDFTEKITQEKFLTNSFNHFKEL